MNMRSINNGQTQQTANTSILITATFCRLILNTSRRFIYPFAPAIGRGLGVPFTSVTSLIAANQFTGLLAMFIGPLSDRIGFRFMMLAGLGTMVVGMLAVGFFPFYSVALAAMLLAGLGKSVFDPALQAYIGERVPFERRGYVIGILEISWAASALAGIPAIGVLIDRFGWRAPFFTLGALGVAGIWLLRKKVPKEADDVSGSVNFKNVFDLLSRVIKERPVLGALGFGFFMSAANDNLFVVYGVWLEQSFGLSIIGIGFGAGVIGGAELAGEFLTAAVSDRLGLKRSIMIGLIVTSAIYVVLPFAGSSVFTALSGIFILFVAFEFTVVSFLSLCTELSPGARATILSGFLAAAGLGRVVGAVLGGGVWLVGGIAATGIVSAIGTMAAFGALMWGLKYWNK